MPELVNHAPFPNFRYYAGDNRGGEFGVVIVKATYAPGLDGRLEVAEEQAPLLFTDASHGAVNVSSVWHPSDLVPYKPRTDILVNAVARALGGVPAASWLAGVRVSRGGAAVVEKRVRVTGPRRWEPDWARTLSDEERAEWTRHRAAFRGWRLSDPAPVAEVALRYELAFGGTPQAGTDAEGRPVFADDPYNPIGCGWLHPEGSDHTQAHPAPQILGADEVLDEPYTLRRPHTLGPIPCAWEPRLPLAGTYDQGWLDEIWPDWPPDYDFAYHNAAHPDLICPGHLVGDEHIQLAGLTGDARPVHLDLPGEALAVAFAEPGGAVEVRPMVLDTVLLDVAAPRWADARVFLSWRVRFEPDRYATATILRRPAAGMPDAGPDAASITDQGQARGRAA